MAVEFHSCQGKSCGPKGGPHLLRDIEELCWESSGVSAHPTDCLGLCGLGPNVQICTTTGAEKVKGNVSWQRVEELVLPRLEKPASELRRKLGRLKFAHRREHLPEERNARLQEAFDVLEEAAPDAECTEPQLFAELLMLRAQNQVLKVGFTEKGMAADKQDGSTGAWLLGLIPLCGSQEAQAQAAVADAQRAVKLSPEWPQAYKVLAITLEAAGRREEALIALRKAAEVKGGRGLHREALRAHLRRLEKEGVGPNKAEFMEIHSREEPLHPSCRGNYDYRIAPPASNASGGGIWSRALQCVSRQFAW
eukprot:TRINITY_DN80339_c0_g1_i1.p1 TRINITY_DN80339_c0_g1~~TRINITY_DN80339_c0_g1_i1.p1  ORF type:complete len:317 (-),score=77.36 TRINITY_DN80339_c0_g1_i1:86-1009(-)